MSRKRVRMIDVATAAGVSATTASFVLNGRDANIPLKTRERVLTIARELDYHGNAAARALATGRTNRIGIVLNSSDSFAIGDTYFTEVLSGIVSSAPKFDCNVLLHTAHNGSWCGLESDILSGGADGVILVGRYARDALTRSLLDAEFPTVCVSYNIDHPRCYSVDCDNEAAAYLAIQHLLRLGHHDIAFFFPGCDISWGRERLAGAQRAMVEAGLSPDNLHLFSWSETERPSLDWCRDAVQWLVTHPAHLTAVVCCEEVRAQHLVEMFPAQGLRVPENVAVISFNSTQVSTGAHPPLTSVHQPLTEIGAAAVELLVEIIVGREPVKRCVRFPASLHIRESCGASFSTA